MARDFVVRFEDFDGGDFGTRDPSKSQNNQWAGENLLLYDSGLVGTRPGFKKLTVTGLPNHPVAPGPVGFEVWDDDLVIILSHPYRIPIPADGDTSTAAVSMGNYAAAATGPVSFAQAEGNLYSTTAGALYKHAAGTDNTAAITLPAACSLTGITRWNYRIIGWDTAVPWRLWYSTVDENGAQWDTWGDNNFLDLPSQEPITALIPWYNQLFVGTRSGWTQVSGTIDTRPYVRTLSRGNGPSNQRVVTATTDNRALYWGTEPTPIWFNGDYTRHDRNFRVKAYEANDQYTAQAVVAAPTGRKLFMLGETSTDFDSATATTSLLMYRDGDWSPHSLPFKLGALAPADFRNGYYSPADTIFAVQRPTNVGEAPVILAFDHNVNRPGQHTDDWVSSEDADQTRHVAGHWESPAWYDGQSRMVMVRNVVVQFRKWGCGSDSASCMNELQCRVRPLGRYDDSPIDTATQLWSEPSERAALTGTDDSIRFGFGEQGWANGFQVVLPVMRGVAIRSVEVHCNVQGPRT